MKSIASATRQSKKIYFKGKVLRETHKVLQISPPVPYDSFAHYVDGYYDEVDIILSKYGPQTIKTYSRLLVVKFVLRDKTMENEILYTLENPLINISTRVFMVYEMVKRAINGDL